MTLTPLTPQIPTRHLDFSLFTFNSSLPSGVFCAPPESNIRIYSIRLNTAVRQLQTYSPKGYTSVTVGVSPTANNKSTRHLD